MANSNFYVLLMSWTEAGIEKIKAEAKAAEGGDKIKGLNDLLDEKLREFGPGLVSFHWTLGEYDAIATIEANNDVTMAGVVQWLANDRGVQVTTLKGQDAGTPDPDATPGASTLAGVLYRCYFGGDDDDAGGGNVG